jgi:hypothetical protein
MLSRVLSTSTRGFSSFSNGIGWGVSLPAVGAPNGLFATKYRITRPYNEQTTWDDFLIALPEQDQLWRFTKDVPLFVRYLKLVTDKESRQADFRAWVTKHKDGLVVESDVFLTVDELLAIMWKNGYSDQERNAIQFTFPGDYRFHYPEISVLFDLPESDAYKFCMRTRMDKSHIGELSLAKTKRQGLLRDHWLLYASGWFLFKNYPFFNYAFFLKTWGFTVWFVSAWALFSRQANRLWKRNEQLLQQKVAEDVMTGEDAIVAAMRRFANDAKVVNHVGSLKAEITDSLTQFSSAFVNAQRHALNQRVTQQLENIARAEATMASNFQDLLVNETLDSFKADFAKSADLQRDALDFAVARLSGATDAAVDVKSDPVRRYLLAAVEAAAGGKSERLKRALADAETNFHKSFAVQKEEAAEIKKLGLAAGGVDKFDFQKLNDEELKRLEQLYQAVNDRCGFVLPDERELEAALEAGDADCAGFVETVNKEVDLLRVEIRQQRLKAFVASFL